jgi:hypothetical protein
LIPEERKLMFCADNRYLLIATDVQQEMKEKGINENEVLEETVKKLNSNATGLLHSVL